MSAHSLDSLSPVSEAKSTERPFSRNFFDEINAVQRGIYFKVLTGGVFSVILAIFAVFSIYWGSLWKTPVQNLDGWVIDFDGGLVGQTVVQALISEQVSSSGLVTWNSVPSSQFPGGLNELATAIREEKTFVAVAINPGSSARLQASIATPNASYNGSEAITIVGNEARNENAYRLFILPSAEATLAAVAQQFAVQIVRQVASTSSNLTTLLTTSPQTIVSPISYTSYNVAPFAQPVATAVTFVGLIYQLILSFFVVMLCNAARDAAKLNQNLTLRSLIITRLVSCFVAYFFVSLFYALLSLAFQLDFSRKFGHSGFLVFWMLNWVGMLAVGLALESLMALLTVRFLPFFMILWVIVNVSVCIFPIEMLPVVFRYGYAMPFYNVSRAVRCIVFGTKNTELMDSSTVGLNFGILIAWAAISCITLPLIQWFVRRRDIAQADAMKALFDTEKSEAH
ncbi:hypothetical protein H0H92_007402 [Tricholoma furcatifolium]|nr:hypothetical protein H0H92_007402 [Tricholoma furcatifolium]